MRFKTTLLLGLIAAMVVWFKLRPVSAPALAPPHTAPAVSRREPLAAPPIHPATITKQSTDKLAALVLARLQQWDDDDDPALRPERLRELDRWLSGTNALEIVQSLPPELVGYAFASPSLRAKLLANPEASLEWMACHPNVQSQLLTLLQDMGTQGRSEVQQYLGTLPDGAWKQKVLAASVNETLSRDPAAAVATALAMDAGPQQRQWLMTSTEEWAKQDPNAAVQWAARLPDLELCNALIGSIAEGAADDDPEQAANFLLQVGPSETVLNKSVANIVWSWSQKDPAAAAAWIAPCQDSPMRQAALQSLLSVWGNHAPAAATAWVEQLPAGDLQIQAARDLLSALPDSQP